LIKFDRRLAKPSPTVDGRRIGVGSIRYFETLGGLVDNALSQKLDALQDAGKTCVLVGEMGEKTTRILGDPSAC
jgi:cation transport ATPase